MERLRFTLTSIAPRDQVSPLLVVSCSLFPNHAIFIHKNGLEPFLSAHFLFWEILNLNLTFAVCRLCEA